MLTDSICMATDQVQEQIEQLISVKISGLEKYLQPEMCLTQRAMSYRKCEEVS